MNSLAEKLAYLAAFIDGEGWVHYKKTLNRGSHMERGIGFTNTDKGLFDVVISYAKESGFDFGVSTRKPKNPNHSQRWDAYLRGGYEAYKKFLETVPLKCERKRLILQKIVFDYPELTDIYRYKKTVSFRSMTPEARKLRSLKMHEALKKKREKEFSGDCQQTGVEGQDQEAV